MQSDRVRFKRLGSQVQNRTYDDICLFAHIVSPLDWKNSAIVCAQTSHILAFVTFCFLRAAESLYMLILRRVSLEMQTWQTMQPSRCWHIQNDEAVAEVLFCSGCGQVQSTATQVSDKMGLPRGACQPTVQTRMITLHF
eukprot:929377-Amphidinium_carterae.1